MYRFTILAASALLALDTAAAQSPFSESRVSASYTLTASDHLDSARRAFAEGAWDIARREFVISAALDRDAGRIPIEASFGLAHCLYSQSYNREAALVMNKLADEVAQAGDVETEARALADAVWLNADSGQWGKARQDALRLRNISTDSRLTPETRKLIKARIG